MCACSTCIATASPKSQPGPSPLQAPVFPSRGRSFTEPRAPFVACWFGGQWLRDHLRGERPNDTGVSPYHGLALETKRNQWKLPGFVKTFFLKADRASDDFGALPCPIFFDQKILLRSGSWSYGGLSWGTIYTIYIYIS